MIGSLRVGYVSCVGYVGHFDTLVHGLKVGPNSAWVRGCVGYMAQYKNYVGPISYVDSNVYVVRFLT